MRRLVVPLAVFALGALASLSSAQVEKAGTPAPITKEAAHARLLQLAQDIESLRLAGAALARIDALREEYRLLSAALGGDDPAHSHAAPGGPATAGGQGTQQLTAGGCSALTTTSFVGAGGPISQVRASTNFQVFVATAGTYLWDVDLNTAITHTWCSDLDITLTSPAGTTVTITTDNAGSFDHVFNGTDWDDNVNVPVTDHTFTNGVAAASLSAEGRLAAFRGENPTGIWTLRVTDDLGADVGAVNGWSLDVRTLAAAPVESTSTASVSPALALTDNGATASVLALAGAPLHTNKVTVYVEIAHPQADDLDITLTSPAGTAVKLTTDNGAALDNVFNGTLFDPDAPKPVTDVVYANNVVVLSASPEGSFDNFLGQNPNGNWTLTITDDAAGNVGTLARWDLSVTSSAAPAPSAVANFPGTIGPINDLIVLPQTFTIAVAGVGNGLWDLDLTTFLTHTAAADLDVQLISPLGTIVTITTDNGGTNDNVFDGTVWDDNALDPVTDHVYVDGILASPLSPEARLISWRGENPNGIWTLSILDDVEVDDGNLASWSLDLTTEATPSGITSIQFGAAPGQAIPDNGTLASVVGVFAQVPSISDIEVQVVITHTDCSDLDITLTSPAGTVVKLTTDNGGTLDNVFNGTLFDSDWHTPVSDFAFVNNVSPVVLSPEGGFGAFDGQDPNGNWTLTVTDDLATGVGTLAAWYLTVRTCPNTGFSICSDSTLFYDHTTGCPCGNTGAAGRGCGHSFDANGAELVATGSIAGDTVHLRSAYEPAAAFTLFLQHNAPGETIFHDGVLCAGGTLTRLRGRNAGVTQFMPPGEALFPNSNFANDATLTLSSRGGTFPGSGATMFYSAFYRNASTTFCPPATANVTNGWRITW